MLKPFSRILLFALALSATLGLVSGSAWAGKHKKGANADGTVYQPEGQVLRRKPGLDDPGPALAATTSKPASSGRPPPVSLAKPAKPTHINNLDGLKVHSLFE